jgi:hypothetical protein
MTPGVFYASQAVATAIAEMTFARLLFFADSPATPWPANPSEHTAFQARFHTSTGLDLTAPPFDRARARLAHHTEYEACQALAEAAREAGVQAIRYPSARDPAGGVNVALLACAAFSAPAPLERQTWRLHLDSGGVRALCEFPERRLSFDTTAFADDPRIATMPWVR